LSLNGVFNFSPEQHRRYRRQQQLGSICSSSGSSNIRGGHCVQPAQHPSESAEQPEPALHHAVPSSAFALASPLPAAALSAAATSPAAAAAAATSAAATATATAAALGLLCQAAAATKERL